MLKASEWGEGPAMTEQTPQGRVAQLFMEHKGLGEIEPYDIEQVEGESCWYFYYRLPEGKLELEVSWEDGEWDTLVTSFVLD
jgi:hypothetical protein